MNAEIPEEVKKELESIRLDSESEALAKQIGSLSESLKSEEMKIIESQQEQIGKLQAQLDELPEMLAQAFMAGQADCGDDPSWASAVEYRDSILNPPVKEEE